MVQNAFSRFTNLGPREISPQTGDIPLFAYKGDGVEHNSILGVLRDEEVVQITLLDSLDVVVVASFSSGVNEDGIHYSPKGIEYFAKGGDIPQNLVTGEDLIIPEQRLSFQAKWLESADPEVTGFIY